MNGTGRRRLGPPVLRGREPRWSPDGRRIAFLTLGDGHAFRVLELRTGRVRTVFEGATYAADAWSPDGHWLAAVRTTPIPCDESAGECSERLEIWIVSATGAPRGRVYVNESGGEIYGVDWRPARSAG